MIFKPNPKISSFFFLHEKGTGSFGISSEHYLSILEFYCKTKCLRKGQQVHAKMVSSGVLLSDHNQKLHSKLVKMYVICGNIVDARVIFDQMEMSKKSVCLWNIMIRWCTHHGFYGDALGLYRDMHTYAWDQPNKLTFPFVFKACCDLSLLKKGMQIHCHAIVYGVENDSYIKNTLLAMYMRCGRTNIAHKMFCEMSIRTTCAWNTMITGYFQNGFVNDSLLVFHQMKRENVEPDWATLIAVLPICAHLKDIGLGNEIHKFIKRRGFSRNLVVMNALIDMYAKCGCYEEARELFDKDIFVKDIISWTTMIGGYALNGRVEESFALCHEMILSGIRPNSVTMVALLSACKSSVCLKYGMVIHGLVIRYRIEENVIIETALIDMYNKCERINLSHQVFSRTSRRKSAQWSAIISGYSQNGLAKEAINIFKQMREEGVCPEYAAAVCVIPAYADLADLQMSRNLHGFLVRTGFDKKVEANTGLIDMYSKSGGLDYACKIFNGMQEKDIISWTALISGYGMHGHGQTAILIFKQMVEEEIVPNEITFTIIFNACSHAGLVDEGLYFFNIMVEKYHLHPQKKHYACLVDLLGRAGRLKEAYQLIKTMPEKPSHGVWGALLGACVIHENGELGKVAAEQLFKSEPENTGSYILLANIYASMGKWEEAESLREMIVEKGLRKSPGCSYIESTNQISPSFVSDTMRQRILVK